MANSENGEFLHVHEDVIARVNETMPDDEILYDLGDLFKVFGDTTRIKILYVLLESEMCVYDLAQVLNLSLIHISFDPFYGAKDVVIVLAQKECTYIYDGSLAMGNMMNAAWSMGIDSRWIHRAKEVFETEEGKTMLRQWGLEDEVEGIGFCILGYARDEKEKTEIKPGRVYYV